MVSKHSSKVESGIIIHFYGDNVDNVDERKIILNNFNHTYTAEEICYLGAEHLKIGWLGYPLFAVAEINNDSYSWYPPTKLVSCSDKTALHLWLRIRCIPSVRGFESLKRESHKYVLDYYFHQLRNDFLKGKLKYNNKNKEDLNSKLLGLSVYDKVRYGRENDLSFESLLKINSKYFIPDNYMKESFNNIIQKKKLETNFKPLIETEYKRNEPLSVDFLKQSYIKALLDYCTSYGNEEFMFVNGVDSEHCVVQPYDQEYPGIVIKMRDSDPSYYTRIEDIMDVTLRDDIYKTIHINRKSGSPLIIKYEDKEMALSFVSLLDCYHRLIEDYDHSLCKDVESKYVLNLYTFKCHGPVGKTWSKIRLMEKYEQNPRHNYLLKMSQETFGSYTLVYVDNKKSVKFHQIHFNRRTNKYSLEGAPMVRSKVNDSKTPDDDSNANNSAIKVTTSIDSDRKVLVDGDDNDGGMKAITGNNIINNLLDNSNAGFIGSISDDAIKDNNINNNFLKNIAEFTNISQLVNHYKDILGLDLIVKPTKPYDPHIFLCQSERHDLHEGPLEHKSSSSGVSFMPTVKCTELIGDGRFTNVYKMKHKFANIEKFVAVKQLKPGSNKYLPHFLSMVNRMIFFRRHPNITPAIALCLNDPFSFIVEYAPMGCLKNFLINNKRSLMPFHFMFISEQIAQALYELHEVMHQVHGNINCSNVLVFEIEKKKLPLVKLADPGMYLAYNELPLNHEINVQRLPWLAPECRGRLQTTTFESDNYSFGTTIWEMYMFGEAADLKDIQEKVRNPAYILPQPAACSDEMYAILKQCWAFKPEDRINIRDLVRDIRNIYQKTSDENDYKEESLNFGSDNFAFNSFRQMNGGGMINSAGANGIHSINSCTSETPLIGPSSTQVSINHSQSGQSDLSNMTSHTALDDFTFDYPDVRDEISSSSLTFKVKDVLGQGHYGTVYKGYYTQYDGSVIVVALKCLKNSMFRKFAKEFEFEYTIMKDLKHDNIVCVIGRCVTLSISPQVLVMEYAEEGCLKDYLPRKRQEIGLKLLVTFGFEIACGMAYLIGQNIIHRDLAARNVLVTKDQHMKIGDFGLSRALHPDRDYYKGDENKELPAPWCAPEALAFRKFTEFTDVWSYGVTLWEVFSFGAVPNLCEIKDLWLELHKGARLKKPSLCPEHMYQFILSHCWSFNENERKTFEVIVRDYKILMDKFY